MIDRRQLLQFLAAAGLVAGPAGCAARAADPAAPVAQPESPPQIPAAPVEAPPPADFQAWLAALRVDAQAQGIRATTLDAALTGLKPLPRVIELDHKQPEATVTFDHYVKGVVNPVRIAAGKRHLEENRALLTEIGAKYGVQPRFIVALWGIETDFGAFTGGFSVIASLATLAYESSRPALFRAELLAALKILDEGHIKPADMKGSWAGAMGQTQFMPSSFLKFAVDYDGSGRRDIWTNRADVFASIANYLARSGWDGAHTWGREITVPANFDPSLTKGNVLKPLSEWQALGVRCLDGTDLPRADLTAGIVQPGGAAGPSLLTYGNYRVIMKWNRSTYFATAVSYLADRFES